MSSLIPAMRVHRSFVTNDLEIPSSEEVFRAFGFFLFPRWQEEKGSGTPKDAGPNHRTG